VQCAPQAAKFQQAFGPICRNPQRSNGFTLEYIFHGIFFAMTLSYRRRRKLAMTEKVHHFSVSATDELNNDRGVQRLPPKHFVLLMIGLVALLLLLYVQIIW